MNRPWFWKKRNGWYVSRGRSQVRIGDTEAEAAVAWAEMLAVAAADTPNATVAAVAELYLEHASTALAATTYTGYAYYLASFANAHGAELVRSLKPYHVTRWLAANKSWGSPSHRHAISVVKRCFNWAVQEGLIDRNPLAGVKRPAARRREIVVEDSQHEALLAATDGSFGDFLRGMLWTGLRPGLLAAVRVEDISADGDSWVLGKHKTRRWTGRPLVVYLGRQAKKLTKRLRQKRTTGPLFRNSLGGAWKPNAVQCRMKRLRKKLKLPKGIVCYSYRHRYVTSALENGVAIATVAQLIGHTSTRMIDEHYGHLEQRHEHLKEAAKRAVS